MNIGRVTRDRWSESGFLQRGVYSEPDFRALCAASELCETERLSPQYQQNDLDPNAMSPKPLNLVESAMGGRGLLTARRVIAWGAVLLAAQAIALAFLVAGSYGVVPQYGPSTVSFVGFYAAGQLAVDGHPQFAYDEVFHYETQEALTQEGVPYLPFLYPPVYLLLCAPLALLPFLPAFILFEATTLESISSSCDGSLGCEGVLGYSRRWPSRRQFGPWATARTAS